MYCHKCGSQLKDGALFCTNCGASVGDDIQTTTNEDGNSVREMPFEPAPPIGSKKKNSTWKNVLIAIAVIIGIWWLATGDYGASAEDNYKQGVAYYERHDYQSAKKYFDKLDEGYKSTELYNILCRGHINGYLTDEQIKTLKHNLDFEDTKSLLLSDTDIAFGFLLGYWTAEDGKHTIEFYEQGDHIWAEYKLPFKNVGDSEGFYITDGMYGVKTKKDGETTEEVDIFRISILGPNKIAVVALKDNSRYVMTRDS